MARRITIGVLLLGGASGVNAQEAEDGLSDRFSLEAKAGFQVDSNITVSDSDVDVGQGDILGIFDTSIGVKLSDNLEVGYSFFQSAHQDLTDFNLRSQNGFLFYDRDIGPVSFGLGYQYFFTQLGGLNFLALHNVRPTAGFFVADPLFVNLHVDYTNKNFLDDGVEDAPIELEPGEIAPPPIQGRDADTVGFGADAFYFFGSGGAFASFGYRYETEDATDPQFDFDAHIIGLDVSQPINFLRDGAVLKLSYDFSDRNYGSITPSIGVTRDDARHILGFGVEAPLLDFLQAELRYSYTDSNSNLPAVDFTNSSVSLQIGVEF